jgi:hypothetical protein
LFFVLFCFLFAGFILTLFPSVDFAQICADIQFRTNYYQNETTGEWLHGPGIKKEEKDREGEQKEKRIVSVY